MKESTIRQFTSSPRRREVCAQPIFDLLVVTCENQGYLPGGKGRLNVDNVDLAVFDAVTDVRFAVADGAGGSEGLPRWRLRRNCQANAEAPETT